MAGGLVDGWNTCDYHLRVWFKVIFGLELKSLVTKPFGVDTDGDSGNSDSRVGSTGEWSLLLVI